MPLEALLPPGYAHCELSTVWQESQPRGLRCSLHLDSFRWGVSTRAARAARPEGLPNKHSRPACAGAYRALVDVTTRFINGTELTWTVCEVGSVDLEAGIWTWWVQACRP